ncbi:MAG: hypothetical protein J0G94_05995 [Sphingomonadales bacterium]|nr:hypothetical protein [Sphingomonadales bacterium]
MSAREEMVAKLAADQAAFAQATRARLIQEANVSLRWLKAALLALNGAAALAVLDSALLPLATKGPPLGLFFAGLLAALAMGFLAQRANMAMIAPIAEAHQYWIGITAGEALDPVRWAGIEQAVADATGQSRWVKIAAWLSVAAFSAGCGAVAYLALWGYRLPW